MMLLRKDITRNRDWSKPITIQEIEAAITKLPTKQLIKLSTWLEEYQADVWDQQIEADLAAGLLDAVLKEVDAEYEAGLATPL